MIDILWHKHRIDIQYAVLWFLITQRLAEYVKQHNNESIVLDCLFIAAFLVMCWYVVKTAYHVAGDVTHWLLKRNDEVTATYDIPITRVDGREDIVLEGTSGTVMRIKPGPDTVVVTFDGKRTYEVYFGSVEEQKGD